MGDSGKTNILMVFSLVCKVLEELMAIPKCLLDFLSIFPSVFLWIRMVYSGYTQFTGLAFSTYFLVLND